MNNSMVKQVIRENIAENSLSEIDRHAEVEYNGVENAAEKADAIADKLGFNLDDLSLEDDGYER